MKKLRITIAVTPLFDCRAETEAEVREKYGSDIDLLLANLEAEVSSVELVSLELVPEDEL